jgi:hypothetical protein
MDKSDLAIAERENIALMPSRAFRKHLKNDQRKTALQDIARAFEGLLFVVLHVELYDRNMPVRRHDVIKREDLNVLIDCIWYFALHKAAAAALRFARGRDAERSLAAPSA